MNKSDDQLAHALMLKFGTGPGEPTEGQLAKIKQEIRALGRLASNADWLHAVTRHCPGTGKHFYAGLDNSDLNTLLTLAVQATRGQ